MGFLNTIKVNKKDIKLIIEQSKEIIKVGEIDKKIAKEAIRKSNINILTAKAIIKNLGTQ